VGIFQKGNSNGTVNLANIRHTDADGEWLLCSGRYQVPCPDRLAPELAKRSTADEMTLYIEGVVDGRLGGQETLSRFG